MRSNVQTVSPPTLRLTLAIRPRWLPEWEGKYKDPVTIQTLKVIISFSPVNIHVTYSVLRDESVQLDEQTAAGVWCA